MRPNSFCIAVALVPTIMAARANGADDGDQFFRQQVAPLLAERCARCHSGSQPKGGLDVTRRQTLLVGGETAAAVVPGRVDESLVVDYVSGDDPEMPLEGQPLSHEEVAALRQWIAAGANWPDDVTIKAPVPDADWWSLQPVGRPAVPTVDTDWVRTPIDAFILAKLNEIGLDPSPEADRRTLIRRLTYDLHGLPPTPAEVDEFVSDADPRAYERLVERLLASPRYGERWARHWLDVVHYADTHGYDKDKRRDHAWHYRDYVIRALNDDQPYREFVMEQLAGDVLAPDDPEGIAATGFIVAGPWDFVGHIELREGTVDKQLTRLLDRDDMVMNAMSTFSSLTVHCARCHDHKFDPITQADYYSLQAVFAGVDRADRLVDVDAATARQRADLKHQEQRLAEELQALREKLGALASSEDTNPEIGAAVQSGERQLAALQAELSALPAQVPVFAAASRFAPQGSFTPAGDRPRPVHLLARGSVTAPGAEAAPGTVGCVAGLESRFTSLDSANEGQRRLALAQWIVDERNPLTWRSIVNRVWHYHFGRGLVDTPNDFGRMGAEPSHPKLLDWLAADFRDGEQSLKQLHRLIVTSAVYRQTSAHREDAAQQDEGNRLLWRMQRRRLTAEEIRDAVLATSGSLRQTMYGPGYDLFGFKDDHSPHYDYELNDPDDPRTLRRTVYRFIVRSVPDPFMETLDCADPSLIVPVRNTTVTALQALALLNNTFMVRQAERFSERAAQCADESVAQIDHAFRVALSRPPTPEEAALLGAHVRRHGLSSGCRLILNMNEFIFVD